VLLPVVENCVDVFAASVVRGSTEREAIAAGAVGGLKLSEAASVNLLRRASEDVSDPRGVEGRGVVDDDVEIPRATP
jgi:hypothetical protein